MSTIPVGFPELFIPPGPTPAGSPFPGHPGSIATDFQLLINGRDVTPLGEWDAKWEERADGTPGQFSATLAVRPPLDPSVDWGRVRDRIQAFVAGNPVFDGEIVQSYLDLPPGLSTQHWKIAATDWNTVLDLRLVGQQLGWVSYDGGVTYQELDTYAVSGSTDQATVRSLFSRYAALPSGAAFDVTTFVNQYIGGQVLFDGGTGVSHLDWSNSHSTLKSALDQIKSLGTVVISCWIGPDLRVRWLALGNGDGGVAPAAISDTGVNGSTIIGARALRFPEYTGSYMPQAVFVNGTVPNVLAPGTALEHYGGTGWALFNQSINLRQISVDAQAADPTQRDAAGAAYTAYSLRARIRGTAIVSGRPDEKVDGWHAGQMLTVTDARLPASVNGLAWPIQRVQGELVKGQNLRRYTLDFGDMPTQTFSAKWRSSATHIGLPNQAAYVWNIAFSNAAPKPGVTQKISLQAMDLAGKPVRASGLRCSLTLQVSTDGVTWATASDGSLGATSLVSDRNGTAVTTFTMGSASPMYRVSADTPLA